MLDGKTLATTLFFAGCNFTCPYCHNKELPREKDLYLNDVLIKILRNRALNNTVIFSGGEALLSEEVASCLVSLHNMGFKIGVHTNGSTLASLSMLIDYIDFIGLDFKSWFNKVHLYCPYSPEEYHGYIKGVLKLIRKKKVSHEIRTTLYNFNNLLSLKDLKRMAVFLRNNGVKEWYWQRYEGEEKEVWNKTEIENMMTLIKVLGLKIIFKG
jgi:pyruvate formate lyase activating enzyme